jgi:sugar phosphate isomerase/epimerase
MENVQAVHERPTHPPSEVGPSIPVESRSAGRTPKISFGSWAFSFGPFSSSPWSFERLCTYAADAGYDGVEINGFRPHPHYADFGSSASYAPLRSLASGLGLGYSGYAPDFTDVPPAEASEQAYLKAIEGALSFCEHLDIPLLRVDSISSPTPLPSNEYGVRFDRLASNWRAAAEACEKSGVGLVWEFEPGFWLNRPSEVLQMVEAVDHPNFKILFDTSHAYTGVVAGGRQGDNPELLSGGVAEYASLIEPYLGHLHLIDSDGSLHDEETSSHIPFGEGQVDFLPALEALKPSLDRLEWWTVDFCFCPTTERDGRKAVPFVRGLAEQVST